MCITRACRIIALWLVGQALWLLPAYLLEFRGWRVFEFVWLASLVFFTINLYILRTICRKYTPPLLLKGDS